MKNSEIIISLLALVIIYLFFFINLNSAFEKEFKFEDEIKKSYLGK